MKKDIEFPQVSGVKIVVTLNIDENAWDVQLINTNDFVLENVLVTSRGYGLIGNEEVKTSILRHSLGNIAPYTIKKIEPIQEELFALNNEYWLSFYIGNKIFDKKYTFLAESINLKNLTDLASFNVIGVVHN